MGTPSDNTYRNTDVTRHATFLSVNNDRAEIGLPPLRYTEFIDIGGLLRGARDFWTPEKRSAKAKKQLRDPKTKQWIEERGNLDIHRSARARLNSNSLDDADEMNFLDPPKVQAKGAAFKLGPPPKSSPTTKVTRLTGNDAVEAMVRAGHPREVVEARYRDRGVVFQVDNPGRNPVAVFVANPKAMVEYRMVIQDNNVLTAKKALAKYEQQAAAKIAAGDPQAIAQLQKRQAAVEKARALRTRQRLAAEAHYGVGGDETIGEMEQQLAAEAAALHMEAISGWPAWKLLREDGTPLPFVLEFDESKLVEGENPRGKTPQLPMANVANITPGRAEDSNRILLNRNVHREELDQYPGHFTPSKRKTVGQHAAAHEAGHLLDPLNVDDDPQPWDSRNPVFRQFIQVAHYAAAADPKKFPYASVYAAESLREWYAEMHAMASQDMADLTPRQQVAVMAYLSMFLLDQPARPGQPTAEWADEMEDWLRKAYSAVSRGQTPPALPDPAEYFEIPQPKVYKNPKWTRPRQKK